MKVVLFYRKPYEDYHHSIEELFGVIQDNLPKDINHSAYVMKYKSQGFIKRFRNCIDVIRKQGDINHITGDVHYIAAFLKKKKTLLTIHDVEVLKRTSGLSGKILKYIWFTMPSKRVKYVTAISEFTKKELLKFVKIDPEKIVVIYDCFKSEMTYSPKEFNTQKPIVLQVGTMQHKNLERVAEALKGMDIKLSILGKLNEKQTVMLKEHGIDYENHFGLPYKEVVELYRKCDFLVFASLYEGFGLPILEAQATGRPVITSTEASMPEVAGDAALLVDPYDARQIRQAIEKVISDEKLRKELIDKGIENIKRFTPEKIAENYASLYRKTYAECKS